jgi:uncharacterized circularly permuted ATP-grasp superfamily protein/uncharacterized alpha-E superfamily protein
MGSGEVRGQWQALMRSLEALGRDEFAVRIENGRRILREHGVSCFSAGPDGERDNQWELDFLPFIISAEEWRALAAGLIQRARLLNLVLGDLHGVHRLVRDGFLPAPLIFANPGYLRACQAVRVPGNHYLQLYAADLARGPDGAWRVLADRTQAPAGLGFALENRSVLSNVLPEALHAVRPRAISDSLRLRHEGLRRLAPAGNDNPAIALLTPGPRNEAYFEHAYLARLLSFTLVEGGDLTVRDRRVCLKTLEGLRPVDVVLRMVGDAFCDPLALRDDSLLGVPGLVEAARAGCVSVANALGSGLVESPAFLPFLPSLAMHLLGEELKLPSVDTWWCGHAADRRYVEEHLDELWLRPAFAAASPPERAGGLSNSDREVTLGHLRERAYDFVAQREIALSRAPIHSLQSTVRSPQPSAGQIGCEPGTLDGGQWTGVPVVLRLFVLFDGKDYVAVPGGNARLMEQEALGTAALPLAGRSKDVWVLPEAGQRLELPHAVAPPSPSLERLASDLPSRSAENLFWLGRYTERLEHLLRVCRSTVGGLKDEPATGRPATLVDLLRQLKLAPKALCADSPQDILQAILLALLFDESHAAGARHLLKRIQAASFSVRDRLSGDTWRILNRLTADATQPSGQFPLMFAGAILNTLVLDLAAFSGMEMENMTRGHGWVFLDLGRRLERGSGIARLVEGALRCAAPRELLLEPLLDIADSMITYRRRYFAEPRLTGVLDLLLLDATNPRALAFQLRELPRRAGGLPSAPNPEGVAEIQRRLAELAARLEGVRAERLARPESAGETADWLGGVAVELGSLSDLVTHVYFSQVLPRVS